MGKPDLKAKCPKCGYSIVGLKGDKCPECGVNLLAAMGTAGRKAAAKQQLKTEYLWAVVALLGGMALLAGVMAMQGTIDVFGIAMLRYAIFVPVGLGVYLLCCAIWIGFDQPLGITALRLAAIYMICDACFMAIGLVTPVRIVGRIFSLVLMAGLMIKWLDIEWEDAKWVIVLTWVAWVLVGALTIYLLA